MLILQLHSLTYTSWRYAQIFAVMPMKSWVMLFEVNLFEIFNTLRCVNLSYILGSVCDVKHMEPFMYQILWHYLYPISAHNPKDLQWISWIIHEKPFILKIISIWRLEFWVYFAYWFLECFMKALIHIVENTFVILVLSQVALILIELP